jgi:DNA repair protein RecO (recombination protein O)
MAIQKTEAVVLRTTKLRETSLIVTFFTRDFGKLQAMAKGVRQPGSPWAGLYEPMNRLEIVFYEKIRTPVHLVTEAAGLDLRPALRRDLRAMAFGYYLTEVLEHFSNPGEPDPSCWQLIEQAYSCLPAAPLVTALLFQLRILRHAGFLPEISSLSREASLRNLIGASSSAACVPSEAFAFLERKPFLKNPGLYDFLVKIASLDWAEAARIPAGEREMAEGEALIAALVAARLDRKLRSRIFLESVDPGLLQSI